MNCPNSDEFLNSHFAWALNFIRKTVINAAALVSTSLYRFYSILTTIVLPIICGCFLRKEDMSQLLHKVAKNENIYKFFQVVQGFSSYKAEPKTKSDT